jgi:pimeloyl-ACP methyl ester carboxylesterase
VALAFALERPARVQALVLNVTTARLRDHERPVQLLRRSFVLSPSLAGWLVHAYAAWRSLPEYLVLSPAAAWATLRRALPVALRHGTPEAVLARRLLVLADVDLEARLPDLRCPALVLTGEDTLDGLVGPRSRRALLERIPHVEHRVVPRTGHFGAFTAPDATLAAVCDFLDRVVR